MTTPRSNIALPALSTEQLSNALRWFRLTTKGGRAAQEALDAVQRSLDQGYWEKGASRSAKAALTKQTHATARAKAFEAAGAGQVTHRQESLTVASALTTLRYGQFGRLVGAHALDLAAVEAAALEADRAFVETLRQWVADWRPIADAFYRLDLTRPPPVFTSWGASPRVTATLQVMGLDGTIEPAPIEWRRVKTPDGERFVGVILWPEGTSHNASRFAGSQQCHACGHRILDPYNWVPLVAHTFKGPRSLWVGHDCAERLLNVKVAGFAQYEGRA